MVLATLAGCGGSSESPRVSEREQRALPTAQFGLGENVCPHEWDADPSLRQAEVRRREAKGRRQLAALETAYRAHPRALVRTTYASSDEGPGTEDITVRALTRSHLQGATEPTLSHGPCLKRLAARLRALLER